jgi:DNA-binding transcriptional regulator PaaX
MYQDIVNHESVQTCAQGEHQVTATRAWVATHSPYNGAALLVHLEVARRADEGQTVHVSIAGLAAEVDLPNDTIAAALQQLVTDGWLAPDRSGGGHYRLTGRHTTAS